MSEIGRWEMKDAERRARSVRGEREKASEWAREARRAYERERDTGARRWDDEQGRCTREKE